MRPAARTLAAALLLLAGPAAGEAPHDAAAAEVARTCARIAGKLASVGLRECLERNLGANGGGSVRGTPILVEEYPPLAARMPRARVLLIGGIHGDEYSSVSVVFKWMRILGEHHSGLFHWRIVPLLNPDGLLQERSQRTNANGVDLNRNFPTPGWALESDDYWIRRTSRDPRRYPGPRPLSEPESRWLAEEIARFDPHVIVSVHAPHGVVDFDGPPHAPDHLGHLHLDLLGTYPGSLGNFAGVQGGIPVVTVELSYAGIMPSPAQISGIWSDLVRWLLTRFPAIREAGTGAPAPSGDS